MLFVIDATNLDIIPGKRFSIRKLLLQIKVELKIVHIWVMTGLTELLQLSCIIDQYQNALLKIGSPKMLWSEV